MEKKKHGLSEIFENEKVRRIIIIVGIVAIALIFLSSVTDFDNMKQSEDDTIYSVEEYRAALQDSVAQMLESIEGVGEAKVLITMENSTESVYTGNSSDTKTKEIEPKIRGAVIACQGGGNPVTAQKVLEAVTKALDISSSKVCISKLSENNN